MIPSSATSVAVLVAGQSPPYTLFSRRTSDCDTSSPNTKSPSRAVEDTHKDSLVSPLIDQAIDPMHLAYR